MWNEIFKDRLDNISNVEISREGELDDNLKNADIVIGYHSTALVEALIYHIPVISLDTGEYHNILPLWKYGLARKVSSLDELPGVMTSLMNDKAEREAFLKKAEEQLHLFNYNNDGLAVSRISAELNRILY